VLPAVPAKPAAQLRDSVGVNVHLSYSSTPYGNSAATKSALLELGVRHLRDGACGGCTWLFPRMKDLAASGIRFELIAGNPRNTSGTLDGNLAAIKANLLGTVDALEGPNEWDNSGDAAWVANLRAFQQTLWAKVQSDPALRALPVIGPSLVKPASRTALGDLSTYLTYGNLHSYPGGRAPSRTLDSEFLLAAPVSGSKPVMATETGYHNALATTTTHPPVDENTAAIYSGRLPLDYLARGVRRAYFYELFDEKPEPANTNMQMHFGLIRNDLTRKPAFTALKGLLATVGDGTPAGGPGALRYDVVGGDTSLRQTLFQRADGSFALALWRDVSVWDPATRTPIAVPNLPVTVRFGQAVSGTTLYRRGSWVSAATAPLTVPVNLGADPVVLRVVMPPLA
jgi:hypothetical protein